MPLKKQGVGVMFYAIFFSNEKKTCQFYSQNVSIKILNKLTPKSAI